MSNKFNFISSDYTIGIYLNGIFESQLTKFFDHHGNELTSVDDEFLEGFGSQNLCFLVSSYDVNELPLNFFKLNEFCSDNLKSKDFLIPIFRRNHSAKTFETNPKYEDWIISKVILNENFFIDVSQQVVNQVCYDHVFIVRGFYCANENGYHFSPLINHIDSEPKTWFKLSSHHVKFLPLPNSF